LTILYSGQKRMTWPIMKGTPALAAAAIIRSQDSTERDIGFSHRIGFFAAAAAITCSSWR